MCRPLLVRSKPHVVKRLIDGARKADTHIYTADVFIPFLFKNTFNESSSRLFQILFDQAQRSVKQQLHNFVKE